MCREVRTVHIPETGINPETRTESNTGGERQLSNPPVKQEGFSHPGRVYSRGFLTVIPGFSPLFPPSSSQTLGIYRGKPYSS